MTAAARFRKDDVARAVAGALKAGLTIERIEIRIDGTIVIVAESGTERTSRAELNPWDDELSG